MSPKLSIKDSKSLINLVMLQSHMLPTFTPAYMGWNLNMEISGTL